MPAIRTEHLSKRYGATVALDSLDLEVREGEVYGYLGPNGAGKTTTIRLLLGLHRANAGRAELFGLDCWRESVVAHRRVAYVAGEPFLWPSLTAAETLEFLGRLHGGTDRGYRERLVDEFQLDGAKKVRALSKGNRQKVQLIAALATRADLLLLDEPTSGLDPAHILEVRDAIAAAAREGATVVFSSHVMAEVEQICTHAAIMRGGQLIASGPVAELIARARARSLEEAYLGFVR
jgi:ABC-2 type transport system ATP-binding protein